MGLSLGHILILAFILLVFFHGRIPDLGDAAGKALLSFKKALSDKNRKG